MIVGAAPSQITPRASIRSAPAAGFRAMRRTVTAMSGVFVRRHPVAASRWAPVEFRCVHQLRRQTVEVAVELPAVRASTLLSREAKEDLLIRRNVGVVQQPPTTASEAVHDSFRQPQRVSRPYSLGALPFPSVVQSGIRQPTTGDKRSAETGKAAAAAEC